MRVGVRPWCQWNPGLEPVHYSLGFTLVVVDRWPERRVVSHAQYSSEVEIQDSIALLGRDRYDFICRCRSWVSIDLGLEARELARLKRLVEPPRGAIRKA